MLNDELTLRQQQLGLQRLENQVRVDVQNALIGLTQARAQYQAAIRQRALQAQTLDAEQKKLALGASTIYNVIQDQQALTAAESNEVAARAAYARAKVELDRSTGQILTNNDISLDEAFRGVVSRPPSRVPALANPRRATAAVPVRIGSWRLFRHWQITYGAFGRFAGTPNLHTRFCKSAGSY